MGRLNKGDFSKTVIGDTIEFYNNDERYTVEITDMKYYSTFKEMITIEKLKNVLQFVLF